MTYATSAPTMAYRPSPLAAPVAVRVNPVVRVAAYFHVLSIPFEMPGYALPLEVPTLTGLVFLLAASLLHPGVALGRVPWAVRWFGVYLWVALGLLAFGASDHIQPALRLFANTAQVVLIFWVLSNLLADARVVRGVFLAIAIGGTVRALLQWFDIGATARAVYTGGERVTVLGQNANLSAIILAVALVTVVGLHATRARWLPRPGLLAWPLAALIGVAIIQTGSRGGLACAAAGLLVLTFRGRTPWRRVLNAVVGMLAIAALAWGALRSDVMRPRLEQAAATGHLAGREKIYPAAVTMFSERPLLGWGLIDNHYEIARRISERRSPTREPHNLVLELLTATGLVGATPFLIGLGLCLRGAWRGRRGALGVLPLAMLAAALTGSISGTWIASKMLWVSLAIALAAGRHWSEPPVALGGVRA